MREFSVTYKDLNKKLNDLEKKISNQDKTIGSVIIAIRRLMQQPKSESIPKKLTIGFISDYEDSR